MAERPPGVFQKTGRKFQRADSRGLPEIQFTPRLLVTTNFKGLEKSGLSFDRSGGLDPREVPENGIRKSLQISPFHEYAQPNSKHALGFDFRSRRGTGPLRRLIRLNLRRLI